MKTSAGKQIPSTDKVISTFWLSVAASVLACAWLLPNHYVPWMTFHSEAWISIVLALVAAAILIMRFRETTEWHWSSVVVAMLVFIPVVQFFFRMIPFWGAAWINSVYLMGLLLALLVGARWERVTQGQCADFLFLAIGIAAIVSMYLQLHQTMGFDGIGPWIMRSSGSRPGANLVQPNQLASLLILGVLAAGWGFMRQKLSASVAILMVCFLLSGVALTQSRTGWLNVLIILITMLLWGWCRSSKRMPWIAAGLAMYFVICVVWLPRLINILLFEENRNLADRFVVGARPIAWRMFLEAIQQQPLFGFGWGQVANAQFQVADKYPQMEGLFNQSHNLFLDLVLWNGIPTGLLITSAIIWWCAVCIRRIKNHEDAILMLFLSVLGLHAMLEYPLHYAYFLLPAGLVVGVLNIRVGFPSVFIARSWVAIFILTFSTTALLITIRDYLHVESSFYALRFEKAHIGKNDTKEPPDVLVLTHLREMIRLARFEPHANLDIRDLSWMRDVVQTSSSPYGIYKLAMALALNGKREEAELWLTRLCKTSPAEQCESIKDVWAVQAGKNPSLAAVVWPAITSEAN